MKQSNSKHAVLATCASSLMAIILVGVCLFCVVYFQFYSWERAAAPLIGAGGQAFASGDGMSKLLGRAGVHTVSFSHSDFSDDDLLELVPCLAKLPLLAHLDLSGTSVTDRGIVELKALLQLQRLDVSATQVTSDGVRTIKSSVPGLGVITDGDG